MTRWYRGVARIRLWFVAQLEFGGVLLARPAPRFERPGSSPQMYRSGAAPDLTNRFAGAIPLEEKFEKGGWQGGRDRAASLSPTPSQRLNAG